MKTKKSNHKQNGKPSAESLLARAASTKKLAKAAKAHLQLVKAEHKQARKAFKQARKAAKRARKDARAALKSMNSKNGKSTEKKVSAKHEKPRATGGRTATPKVNGGHELTVPMISAVPASHEGGRTAAQQ